MPWPVPGVDSGKESLKQPQEVCATQAVTAKAVVAA